VSSVVEVVEDRAINGLTLICETATIYDSRTSLHAVKHRKQSASRMAMAKPLRPMLLDCMWMEAEDLIKL
jgi:hypothetical protein